MLFKTKETVIQYAELTAAINFNSVKPTIRMVESQHIIPLLGSDLYKSLNDAYTSATDESTLTTVQKNLLEQCRNVIGPMLCYYYAPKAEIKINDSGTSRNETGNSKTPFQYQVTNYREQNLREGEMATELLLQFLDDNKSDYPDWVNSGSFKDYRSLFIKSGKEFDKLFSSASPYRNYWAMRSKMLDVEENNIRSLLGDTLYNNLKSIDQSSAGTFTSKQSDLLGKVKRVIAYLTVSFSIPFLNIRIDANGITVMNTNRSSNDNLNSRSSADKDALNVIIEKCEAAARSWSNNVVNFLDANTSDFDGWPLELVVNETDILDDDSSCDDDDCPSGVYGLM